MVKIKYFYIALLFLSVNLLHAQNYSLRFFGNGINAPDLDRVKIRIDNPEKPVDVRGHFTIEFWMKCRYQDNGGIVYSQNNGDGWITGNIIFDRDIYGSGDYGDFGISVGRYSGGPSNTRVIAFGIDRLGNGVTIRGTTNVADTLWHHIAVTRDSVSGQVRLYIDGNLDASGTGPAGNVSYRNLRSTSYPNSDPFIVLGAEKHDAGSSYPSYNGFIDELRISNIIRYTSNFTRPSEPFTTDGDTVGLYNFNENSGDTIRDISMYQGSNSNGIRKYGGNPPGPIWSSDNPFIPVGVELISSLEPKSFLLYQNYPNPFNPKTKIRFDIPSEVKSKMANVKLVMYDVLGREVTTLINQPFKTGEYEIEWPSPSEDGTNYSGGIYFYQITIGDFSDTKKLILMK